MDSDNTAPPAFPLRVLYGFQSEDFRLPDFGGCLEAASSESAKSITSASTGFICIPIVIPVATKSVIPDAVVATIA